MANSGIYWIDLTFDYCVRLLYKIANAIGITYEEINVWLFVIALPSMRVFSLSLTFGFYAFAREKILLGSHYKNELKWYVGLNDLQLELFVKKQLHIKN